MSERIGLGEFGRRQSRDMERLFKECGNGRGEFEAQTVSKLVINEGEAFWLDNGRLFWISYMSGQRRMTLMESDKEITIPVECGDEEIVTFVRE